MSPINLHATWILNNNNQQPVQEVAAEQAYIEFYKP